MFVAHLFVFLFFVRVYVVVCERWCARGREGTLRQPAESLVCNRPCVRGEGGDWRSLSTCRGKLLQWPMHDACCVWIGVALGHIISCLRHAATTKTGTRPRWRSLCVRHIPVRNRRAVLERAAVLGNTVSVVRSAQIKDISKCCSSQPASSPSKRVTRER